MSVQKQREANLDLLRIISMLLIVFLHSIDHSGVLEHADNCGAGMYFYVRFTYALCQICVNGYIMLSGYFMLKAQFRLHKLLTLWLETVFYSFVLKLIFMLTGGEAVSLISLVSCFFPFLTGRYWFLTIYVGLYLLSPFLNRMILALDKKQHTLLNLCLFAIMSVWVSIHPAIAGMNSGGGWGLPWFVVLYITAAWFRLYYTPNGKPWRWFVLPLLLPALMAGAQSVLAAATNVPGGGTLAAIVNQWFRYDSAPVYLMTVSFFAGSLNFRIQSKRLSRAICAVAPLTLGVYLIHAHANVSPWLWETLALPTKMDSFLFPLFQLGAVVMIFALCIGLDALRKVTIGRLEQSRALMHLCDAVSGWIQLKLNMIL